MNTLNGSFTPTVRQRARLILRAPRLAFAPTVPLFKFYGGATITGAHDARGVEYTVCCAQNLQTGIFGLYGFEGDTPILFAPVSGRGSVWVSLFDGKAHWLGWEGNARYSGELPGFAPFPSLVGVAAHLADVEAVMHATQDETARVRALAESISAGNLSDADRAALDWVRAVRALE